MSIQRLMVPGELEPVSHYCHVVRAGDFIYLSGMVGMKANGTRKKIAVPIMEATPMTTPRVFFIYVTSPRLSHTVRGTTMMVTTRKSTTLPAVDSP